MVANCHIWGLHCSHMLHWSIASITSISLQLKLEASEG